MKTPEEILKQHAGFVLHYSEDNHERICNAMRIYGDGLRTDKEEIESMLKTAVTIIQSYIYDTCSEEEANNFVQNYWSKHGKF